MSALAAIDLIEYDLLKINILSDHSNNIDGVGDIMAIPLVWTGTVEFTNPIRVFPRAPQYIYSRPGGEGTIIEVPNGYYYALSGSARTVENGHFEYSTDQGLNWTTLLGTSNPSATGAAPPNSWVRFMDEGAVSLASPYSTFLRAYTDPADQDATGYFSHQTFIYLDNAPTDITSSSAYIVNDAPLGGTMNVATPTDTGGIVGGAWVIEGQSIANLFGITPSTTTNTAELTLGSGAMPPVGQQATISLRYYDAFQTDYSGVGINGQGYAKTLTFTALGTSRDISFGEDVAVNTATSGEQIAPTIATLSNGNFVVTWQSSSSGGIHSQIFNSAGVAQGTELTIATGTQKAPMVAALPGDKYVVAYSTTAGAVNFTIIAADGSVGSETQVAPDGSWLSDYPLSIAANSNGDFQITWVNPTGAALEAATYSATGAVVTALDSNYGVGIAVSSVVLGDNTVVVAAIDSNSYAGFQLMMDG
ncbi:MAG: hypothetical protein ACEQSK_09250, partial [Sphingomonadaceae bacterium]